MIYIILSLLLYTASILLATIASRMIDSNLVSAITASISAIVPIAVIIPMLNKKLFENAKVGIVLAIIVGILIGLFTITLNKSYALNKVAIVAPIVFGGAIFLSAILSFIFLKEKISNIQTFGLTFLGIGILLIIYAKATGR